MWTTVAATDRALAATRPAWGWAAELGLCWLGCHLVADRLDDALLGGLTQVGIAWPEPEWPLVVATWSAVCIELAVCALAAWVRLRGSPGPITPREWSRRLHPGAVADPVFVLATGLAGAWVLAMGTEDLLAPWWPAAALPAAWVAGLAVTLRMVVPATLRVVRATPVPGRRVDGFGRALILLPYAALAARHGWPVWGWLP